MVQSFDPKINDLIQRVEQLEQQVAQLTKLVSANGYNSKTSRCPYGIIGTYEPSTEGTIAELSTTPTYIKTLSSTTAISSQPALEIHGVFKKDDGDLQIEDFLYNAYALEPNNLLG